MKKVAILICVFLTFSSYADIYKAENIKEIILMTQDIFAKRNPEKVFFILPLENFLIKPVDPVLQMQGKLYIELQEKAFKDIVPSRINYINALMLVGYPHVINDDKIVDLIAYIQQNKSPLIITTPVFTGSINEISSIEDWTINYLKNLNIDLSQGIFSNKKLILTNSLKKINGIYPSFYQGLLSYNTDNKNNSVTEVLSVFFAIGLKKMPEIVVAVSESKNYLEALDKQFKSLHSDNEFFGILYKQAEPTKEITRDALLKFWQNFVVRLNKVKIKEVNSKSNNPYEK